MELQIDIGINQLIGLIKQLSEDDKILIKRELEANTPNNANFTIPESQKSIVRERIEKYKGNPDNYLEWDEIEEKIK